MEIVYYEEDNILFLDLGNGEIICDACLSGNVNIGDTVDDIGESTILDVQKSGMYLLQIERVPSGAA
ncbi:hypothetical protein [Thiohalocapsa sp.]|jgi:hypothetical protein|uniref:hypothetical protein n=1 Tax=Thiohalocapsa sp. TaxID=2497641 RepID=UPI0025E66E27|nr:hypothetical protein [Thiohalocapsa sp.]